MCKPDEKTRQYYFFYRATKCPTEAEKIGFAKTHDEIQLLTLEDKNETKYNSI